MFLYYFILFAIITSFIFFFFSSRRRHTRFDCDWSSDVCSSDLVVDTLREVQVADLEFLPRGIGAETERAVGARQIAAAGELVGDGWNRDVRRQVVARAELVAHDRAHRRVLQRGTGTIPRKHVVHAALVRGFAVRHRADDGDLVGDAGDLGDLIGEDFAGQLGVDRTERAAVFDRCEWLGIKRLLRAHPARQEDVDDALGLALFAGVLLDRAAGDVAHAQ